MTDTYLPPVQRALREYRSKRAAHVRAVHIYGRLEELAKDVEAALSEERCYRLGEASNADDENELSENDREALKKYDVLAAQLAMQIG